MTPTKRTVVPFERSAAYWAVRARKYRKPNHLPDAARLMRKALEKSGDPGLALELADIYAAMECYTAAGRCLLRAAARHGLTGDLCFAIGCSALGWGDEDLADRALETALRLDPEGAFAPRAQDILEMYPWRQEEYPPRAARSDALRFRSRSALAAGRKKEAVELAKRAWQKAPTPEAALWLGEILPPRQALPYLTFAARRMPGETRPRLLLARACAQAGRQEASRRHLALAQVLCGGISDVEAFCSFAWEMGCVREALSLLSARLERSPASVDYLRLKYLSLLRLGEKEKAARTLETLLEIDPDDAAGLRYRRHPEDQRPDAEGRMTLSALGRMVYAVPERLTPGPLNRLLHLLVIALGGKVDAGDIYRLAPPLWRRLGPAEKAACDDRRENHYPVAIALYLLLMKGRKEDARLLFAATRGKKRLTRTVRRFAKWTQEE